MNKRLKEQWFEQGLSSGTVGFKTGFKSSCQVEPLAHSLQLFSTAVSQCSKSFRASPPPVLCTMSLRCALLVLLWLVGTGAPDKKEAAPPPQPDVANPNLAAQLMAQICGPGPGPEPSSGSGPPGSATPVVNVVEQPP